MPQPALFEPLCLRTLELANRIVVAPMCQYSAVEGCVNDWHLIHLGQLSLSGAALLTIEATAVVPEGRNSYADVGLWNDRNEAAMGLTVESIRRWSDMPIAIQLNHAGRKASVEVPWKGGKPFSPFDALGWQTFAPSAISYSDRKIVPQAMDSRDLRRVRIAFAAAATRAAKIGMDAIEIHAAHGYLLHQFLSPLSNRRSDEYGGSLEGRMRFPLEVFDAIRNACPGDRVISVRIPGTDWVSGGWDVEQTIGFAKALEDRGCDAIQVSSGGLHRDQAVPFGPSYQVPLARAVKNAVKIPVVAMGLIKGYEQAEAIVATGDADMVALAQTLLNDPRWPRHAAAALGAVVRPSSQYPGLERRQLDDPFESV